MRKILFFLVTVISLGCVKKDKDGLVVLPQKKLKEEIRILKDILQATHPGLYLYTSKKEMNDLFSEVENEITDNLSELEYFRLVSKIVDRIKCSHTSVAISAKTDSLIVRKKAFFPIPIVYVQGAIVVNSDAFSIPLGSKIYSINKNDVPTIFSAIRIFNYADGYNTVYKKFAIENSFSYDYFCAFGGSSKYTVTYTDTTSTVLKTRVLDAMTKLDINESIYAYTQKPMDIDYDYVSYKENFGCITINTFEYNTYNKKEAYKNFLDNTFELLSYNGNKSLILDLRENGGGDYYNALHLYSYLSQKKIFDADSIVTLFRTVPYQEWLTQESFDKVKSIETTQKEEYIGNNYGTFNLVDSFKTEWEPYTNCFNGKLYIIVNENTGSAASLLASILQKQKRAIIVGSETLTNYAVNTAGDFLTYALPYSGVQIKIPIYTEYKKTEQIQSQEGRGLLPDYIIEPTIQDIIAGNSVEINFVTDSLLKMK
jgi:Peptidase family S41